MPVGRVLLKSISASRKLAKLKTDSARLLYSWLIPHLNVNGCYEADPIVIRSHIFSRLKKSIKEIENYLTDLEINGLIKRYQVNNDVYLIVPDFRDKQPNLRPEKEGITHIPSPPLLPAPDLFLTKDGTTPPKCNIIQYNIKKYNINQQPSKELKAVLEEVSTKGLNIYMLISKLKKTLKNQWLPDEVLLKVGQTYLLAPPGSVIKPWPWFIKVITQTWHKYNADQNIKENKDFKKAPVPKELEELMKGIGDIDGQEKRR